MRNSRIILAHNINLDSDYVNVLDYSESDMLSLITTNAIASANNFSFIGARGSNEIKVDFSYNTCLQSNYIAFQNPNYSNKWFFAFVTDVEYISDKSTRIKFKIDAWSTWFSSFNFNTCFVVREHVNDDTFGLHTISEDLAIGDYINCLEPVHATYDSESYVCLGVTKTPQQQGTTQNPEYNGISSGLFFLIVEDGFNLWKLLSEYYSISTNLSIDDIHEIFMIPKSFLPNPTWINIDTYSRYAFMDEYASASFFGSVSFQRNILKVGNNYEPKNKKLYCYPYSYLLVSNNAGCEKIYKYEDFAGQTSISPMISFDILASICPGCNIKLVPLNYKNDTDSTRNRNYLESIQCAKYPIGGWIGDVYTNWLTSNGINIAGMRFGVTEAKTLTGGLEAAIGLATKNPLTIASGIGNVVGALETDYRQKMMPDSSNGNVGASDVMFALKKIAPTFYRMSIKDENAKVIDDYFTRFGYKVNSLKVPNITGRTYFNYVEIAPNEEGISGNIPPTFKSEVNSILRNGVTIWHNHTNIGNYSVNNEIVSQ